MLRIVINSVDDIPKAAKQLLDNFSDETFFAFYGSMGAGKTTFIKSLCKVLGVTETISSPTFSIVNEYQINAKKKIFHFDFYRIKNIEEAFDMGCEEYFYSGNYCFVEWPEKIAELLPVNFVKVSIEASASGERVLEVFKI